MSDGEADRAPILDREGPELIYRGLLREDPVPVAMIRATLSRDRFRQRSTDARSYCGMERRARFVLQRLGNAGPLAHRLIWATSGQVGVDDHRVTR